MMLQLIVGGLQFVDQLRGWLPMVLRLGDATLRQAVLEKLVDKVGLRLRHKIGCLIHSQAVGDLFLRL